MSRIPSREPKNFSWVEKREELAVFDLNQGKDEIVSGAHGGFAAVFRKVDNFGVYFGVLFN